MLGHIREFYETLFKIRGKKTAVKMEKILSHVDISKLSENQAKLCEEDLIKQDLYENHAK